MSRLETYLTVNKISQTEFAETVGSTPSTICRIISGKRFPGRALASRIVRATNGVVTAGDLFGFDVSGASSL